MDISSDFFDLLERRRPLSISVDSITENDAIRLLKVKDGLEKAKNRVKKLENKFLEYSLPFIEAAATCKLKEGESISIYGVEVICERGYATVPWKKLVEELKGEFFVLKQQVEARKRCELKYKIV